MTCNQGSSAPMKVSPKTSPSPRDCRVRAPYVATERPATATGRREDQPTGSKENAAPSPDSAATAHRTPRPGAPRLRRAGGGPSRPVRRRTPRPARTVQHRPPAVLSPSAPPARAVSRPPPIYLGTRKRSGTLRTDRARTGCASHLPLSTGRRTCPAFQPRRRWGDAGRPRPSSIVEPDRVSRPPLAPSYDCGLLGGRRRACQELMGESTRPLTWHFGRNRRSTAPARSGKRRRILVHPGVSGDTPRRDHDDSSG